MIVGIPWWETRREFLQVDQSRQEDEVGSFPTTDGGVDRVDSIELMIWVS